MSHVSPDFVPIFGDCLRMTRLVNFIRTRMPSHWHRDTGRSYTAKTPNRFWLQAQELWDGIKSQLISSNRVKTLSCFTADTSEIASRTGDTILHDTLFKLTNFVIQPPDIWCQSRPDQSRDWSRRIPGGDREGAQSKEVQGFDFHSCGHLYRWVLLHIL